MRKIIASLAVAAAVSIGAAAPSMASVFHFPGGVRVAQTYYFDGVGGVNYSSSLFATAHS